MRPFRPTANGTLACTATTGSVALPAVEGSSTQDMRVRILNLGPSEAFFALGTSAITATAGGAASSAADGSCSLPPGAIEVFCLQPGDTHIAGICAAAGTALLRVSVGPGQ